jgi:hypothetical protein
VLLRQNPHTYWGVLKNLIWYRAGMAEGAHPMITGFFRLKDRRSRRPSLPVEGRWTFARRRAREVARLLRQYARIYVDMQDLWLQTRIRRDDYAFLGDLRQLASQSMQEVKMNWARVHASVAARIATARTTALNPAFAARLEAVRQAIGAVGQASRLSLEASRLSFEASRHSFEESLADLRLRYLPPFRQPSWARRAVSRLNVLSMRRLRPHPGLHEYWERTWAAARHLEFWRVNPLQLAWRLARDSREAMIFFLAMWSERY